MTTTTLEYGDVMLEKAYRIFVAIAAVSGLLTFGLCAVFILKTFERFVAEEIPI